jgi:ATP-dependent metalloprotease
MPDAPIKIPEHPLAAMLPPSQGGNNNDGSSGPGVPA